MKESQAEEDNSSNLESFRKPDSPELPKGAEESFDNGEEKEEDHDLKNAPAATNCDLDWDYSRCNICKNPTDMFVVSGHLYRPLLSSQSLRTRR